MRFEGFVSSRERWIELSKVNNPGLKSISAGSYADSSHFTCELLQTAEGVKSGLSSLKMD